MAYKPQIEGLTRFQRILHAGGWLLGLIEICWFSENVERREILVILALMHCWSPVSGHAGLLEPSIFKLGRKTAQIPGSLA